MSNINELNNPEVKTNAKEFYKIYHGMKFSKENRHSHSRTSFFDSCASLIDMQFGQHIPEEAYNKDEENELKKRLENELNDSIDSLLAERNEQQKNKSTKKKTTLTKPITDKEKNINSKRDNTKKSSKTSKNELQKKEKGKIKHNKPNYNDFLNRSNQYSQMKQAKLEQMRKDSVDESTLNLQDKPTLSANTKEIAKKINRKPLYQKPPYESIEKLEDRFRELYKKESIMKPKNHSSSKNFRNPDDFYQGQIKWMERRKKNLDSIALSMKNSSNQDNTNSYQKINSTSVIIDRVRHYQSTSPYKNKPRYEQMYYHYMQKQPPQSTRHQKKKLQNKPNHLKKRCVSLTNISYNKNVKTTTNKNTNYSYKKNYKSKSTTEVNKKTNSTSKSKSHSKKKNKFSSWMSKLSDPNLNKIKPTQEKMDVLYKINVRQDPAWNDNCLNSIMMKNHDKEIVVDFLG